MIDCLTPPTRCVVVGDGYSGKTSLLMQYANNTFPSDYAPTVFDNFAVNVDFEGQPVNLALWDTAGQHEYARIRPLSYPLTDIFLICFAIDNPASLNNVMSMWYPEVAHHMPGAPIVLVGLKSDVRDVSSRLPTVAYTDALKVSKEMGAAAYVECSAKLGKNVDKVFETVLRTLTHRSNRTSARKHTCTII